MSSEILIGRKEAIGAGLKFYFTGKPCKHGHVANRYVSGLRCVECVKLSTENTVESRRQYNKENAAAIKQQRRQYNKENAAAIKQQRRQYNKENAEAIKEYNQCWREKNVEHVQNYVREYRQKNIEIVKEYGKCYSKQWRGGNKARVSATLARRRATKLQATPSWSEVVLIVRLYEKRDELNNMWGTDYQVDHIIPLTSDSVCGLHVWANLQLLEAEDNNSKNNNYQQDW